MGFSTLLMCEYGPENLKITTIENYEKRIPLAKENFRRAGREDQITFLEGDAGEILKELTGSFDLIFMDAAKGQYIHWLEDVLRLLKPGGILLSDNVLQEGELIQSHYLVERRNRTIYKRMREYLYALKHDPRLLTSILPLGDGGAALSVKKDNASRREVQAGENGGNVRYDEKSGITGAGQQSGSPEDRCGFRRGRGIYRRRSLRASGKSKEFFS